MQFLDSIFVPKSNSKFVPKLLQDYISDKNAKGELREWSVALMSLKNGEPIKVSGLEVIPVNRNVKHETIGEEGLTESTLRAVSTPGEELIDLFEQVGGAPNSTDKVLQPDSGPKLSDVKARYKYRPKSTGLILIYPLKSNVGLSESEFQKLKKETKPSFPLKASGQIFGVSIVFPYSEKKTGPRLYIQNESV